MSSAIPGVGVDGVEAAGRVPRRPRGELAAFDQHDIGDAARGEVIRDADPYDAAADHDDLVPIPHRSPGARGDPA
jgi:hypothetical protein